MKYPDTIYISPRNAIARFNTLIEKYGRDCVEDVSNFKEEKELLTVAKFYLGQCLWTGYDYYLRPWEDVSCDVDVRAINWGEPDNPKFHVDDIQVTEYESHGNNVGEIIDNKIKYQSPHGKESRHLLVSVREREGEKIYHNKLAKEVETMTPSFQSIWLLIQTFENPAVYRVIRIRPTPEIVNIKFNITEMARRQQPPDFINLRRGTNNDYQSEIYEYDLPLPEPENDPRP